MDEDSDTIIARKDFVEAKLSIERSDKPKVKLTVTISLDAERYKEIGRLVAGVVDDVLTEATVKDVLPI
jgi:hypothetical protein